MIGIIYKYTNLKNNKVYIGQTKNEVSRRQTWNNQFNPYGGKKIENARLKYGIDNFKYEVIENITSDNEEELNTLLNQREQYWIKFYDSFKKGYNSTLGGDGAKGCFGELNPMFGKQHTDGSKQLISEHRKGIPCSLKGTHLSEEAKQHLSDYWKNKIKEGYEFTHYKHTEEAIQKMKEAWKMKKENGYIHPNKGISLTEDMKQKISERVKEVMDNEEIKNKCRLGGLIAGHYSWVHNDYQSKRVPKEQLDDILKQGWLKGRGKINWKK